MIDNNSALLKWGLIIVIPTQARLDHEVLSSIVKLSILLVSEKSFDRPFSFNDFLKCKNTLAIR